MFIVDKESNRITPIESKSFHDFGFKEREHLQEWIANQPDCLGESLLIIQKEFDGFSDTNERLDLLALDKSGAVVVIENKLDDTGKDVVWQVLKYVSYCSTLTKQQIKEIFQSYLDKISPGEKAEDKLVEFYDNRPFNEIILNEHDQRMILVAGGEFRKEVTSTVMWMLGHGINLKCFKFSLKRHNDKIFLDVEQIIPVKEAEEYLIKMADKSREEKEAKDMNRDIYELRRKFWLKLLDRYSHISSLFKNVNTTSDHWLGAGSGVSGCPFEFIVTKNYASTEVTISRGAQEENKKIFDNLYKDKKSIEDRFGSKLSWERLDNRKMSRIADRIENVDITNEEDWEKIIAFLCESMRKLETTFKEPLKKAAKQLKTNDDHIDDM